MADLPAAPGEPSLVPLEYLNVPCAGTPSDPMPLGGGARRPCPGEAAPPLPAALRDAIAPLWAGSEDFVSGGYGTFRIDERPPIGPVVVRHPPEGRDTVVIEPGPPLTAPPAPVALPAAGGLLLVTLLLVGLALRRR